MMKQPTQGLWRCAVITMLGAVASGGCVPGHPYLDRVDWEQAQFFDLSHSFGADTIMWPTEQDFRLVVQHAEETPGGYYYASNRLELPEHGGTHIDAPIHFSKNGQMLDQIPIGRLIGHGVRVDVSTACSRDRDYRVTIQDFEQWESIHGRISAQAIILIDTGFARFWPSRQDYLGTELRGLEGVKALHFPGLHPDAAAWLMRERQIKAVGIDTASIDYGQSRKFETHVMLLSHNVPVFENLADLQHLPDRGFEVIALPMKIADGTGGPLRIIAVMPGLL